MVLFSLLSYGQTSSEFLVDTNKLWSNLFDTFTGGPPPYYKTTSYVKFSGDTVINSVNYKKVLSTTDSLQNNFIVGGYIREDSTHKVFYYNPMSSTTRLLYDFNAEVGDSVDVGWYLPMPLVVDTIDSVFVYDRYLKRMVLSFQGMSGEIWIEGIGSLCGIFNGGCNFITGTRHELLCYFENDTLKYSNPDYPYCYYNTVGIDKHENDGIQVDLFPNPVTSFSTFNIYGYKNKECVLEIFNATGQKTNNFLINDDKLIINRRDFSPGIYFYRLITPDGEFVNGKFVVK